MAAPSLLGRALLAVGLMVGFYVLALGVAAGLLYVPYAEFRYLDRIDGRLAIFCVVGAFAILAGIVPRRDRFEPPGPRLLPNEQPRLFAAVESVARATGQAMPAEVYLVPDMNAWVAQRGGVMGVGGRRVMGLGLPLLQTLSVSQLQAVLAHEFGHYHGGDTALGPWLYRTRAAIGRTLATLSGHSSVLSKPFVWYGNAFLRVTHAVSRRQEFAADALAARVVGAEPLASGLERLHGAGAAFGPYWRTEVSPVLAKGYRPPLVEGFSQFLAAPTIADGVAEALRQELEEGRADPYDTHPALRDRLAALRTAPSVPNGYGAASVDDPAAVTLVGDVATLERRLIDALVRDDVRAKLQSACWEDMGERVWAPAWREQARSQARYLEGLTPAELPALARDLSALAVRLGVVPNRSAATPQALALACGMLGAALATALHARGWAVHALPGAPVTLTKGDRAVEPFAVMQALASGALTREAWRSICDAAGIADLDLKDASA